MTTVLFKAFAFLLMIALGFFFKARGILKPDDSQTLMKIIINITLPMAMIAGFQSFSLDLSLAFAIALGFGFNLVLIAASWIVSLRKEGHIRALYLLHVPTYNIGNFVLPFIQGFFPSSAVLCLSMFDAGNNPIGAGIAYSIAGTACGGSNRLSLRDILRKLFHSPPFLAYFCMMVLYIPGVRLPDAFFDLCNMIGQGNCFLAMFTLGLIFELHLPQGEAGTVFRILALRYGLCLLCSAAVFFLTPFSLLIRQTLVLCLLGPTTTLSVAYGLSLGCRHSLIAALSSLSMLISFVLSLGLLVFWA
ncbi:MAG: hypothetical protein Q4F79_03305 [Eubacteriales bacterium]|nr:hypothetical protein [Eubacteriales bacterium]